MEKMGTQSRVVERDHTAMSFDEKFADRIKYELKRAERYRIFVSFLIFDVGTVFENLGDFGSKGEEAKHNFLKSINGVIKNSVREVDSVSNGYKERIGVLCPETARQGAEAAARRVQKVLGEYCSDHFKESKDYIIPVEISSFPDAAGNRSIASYFENN